MKPKNKIKLHKSVIKVINAATEFVNSAIELHKLKSKPIHDYKKGYKNNDLIIVGQRSTEKETIITPNGNVVEFVNSSGKARCNKGLLTAIDNVCSQEEWNTQLNKHLKEKGLHNIEPFAVAPIETKLPMFDYDVLFDKTKTPTAPPLGFNHDFHKKAVEAEKELDRVCKEDKQNKSEDAIFTSEFYNKIKKMLEIVEFFDDNEALIKEMGFEITIEKENQDSN